MMVRRSAGAILNRWKKGKGRWGEEENLHSLTLDEVKVEVKTKDKRQKTKDKSYNPYRCGVSPPLGGLGGQKTGEVGWLS
jgi:hypothetical protein